MNLGKWLFCCDGFGGVEFFEDCFGVVVVIVDCLNYKGCVMYDVVYCVNVI